MGPLPEHNLVERALFQHFLSLKGVRGAAVLLSRDGRWTRVATFGEPLVDRHEAIITASDGSEGGSVEPLSLGGWVATYRTNGPGLDLVLVLNAAPLGPADLNALLETAELRTGWLLVAAIKAQEQEQTDHGLAAEAGTQLLLGAAQAPDPATLADLWIARLEQVYSPALAAIVWTRAGLPRLGVVSGGGPVGSRNDDRHHLEDISLRAVESRVPVLLAADPSEIPALPVHPALVRFDAGSAWLIPVEDGRDIAAVAVLCLAVPPDKAPGPVLADQVAALLSESLTIQRRAHPRLLSRIGNWLRNSFVAIFGRSLWKLKLAFLIVAATVLVTALTPSSQRPAFTARVEAVDRQIVSAPFDGFLSAAPFQSGDRVAPGDLLAQIDDSDLRLQLTQRRSERAETETQLQTARAQRDTARVRQLETRIEQGDIAISLLERQIDRAAARADRPVVIVGGDAWRRVGDRVRLGEPLLEIASPDRFRLRAFVSEDWIAALSGGASGSVVLTAFPDQPIPVSFASTGRDAAMVDGEYVFPVLLTLTPPRSLDVLDGMRGVVRLDLGPASLLQVYTRGLRRWLDRTLWRWA